MDVNEVQLKLIKQIISNYARRKGGHVWNLVGAFDYNYLDSLITSLPTFPGVAIQNTDTTSTDFGQFYYMVDMDYIDGGAPIQ